MLQSAAAARCGLLLAPQSLPVEACDVPGLYNVAVPEDPANAWQTVSGAVGLTHDAALAGAIGEGLERLAAAQVRVPVRPRASLDAAERIDAAAFALFSEAQRARADFIWAQPTADDDGFAQVFHLGDNRPVWVPQECVGLGPRSGEARFPSTSSGLAAHRDAAEGPWLALLRAAQEVLERDALTVSWLNGLGGREIALPADWQAAVARLGGEARAFDLTQRWNPHPVIAVAGSVQSEGRWRHVLGIACRATLAEATQKAALEWAQSLSFAGFMLRQRGAQLPSEPALLRRFDEHAAFYTVRPELWPRTALLAHRAPFVPGERAIPPAAPVDQLAQLQRALAGEGVDLYYRELTTPDVAAAGVRVMRVLSPQLSLLHADERAPFLGGRTEDVDWRYPGAQRHTAFPNPLPHPLG